MAVAIQIAARKAERKSFWTDRRRTLAVIALLVTGTGAAVLGTISAFTSAPTKPQTVTAGTYTFNLADPGSGSFNTAIAGMAPGDFADRLVNLVNTGVALASVNLTMAATGNNALTNDDTNGLQLQITRCTTSWTLGTSSTPATCGDGGPVGGTVLTPSTALNTLIGSGPSYTTGLSSLTGSGTDYLRFHYALPSTYSDNTGLTSTITYTFTAPQATGSYR